MGRVASGVNFLYCYLEGVPFDTQNANSLLIAADLKSNKHEFYRYSYYNFEWLPNLFFTCSYHGTILCG